MPFGRKNISNKQSWGDDRKPRPAAAAGAIILATDFPVTSAIPAPKRVDYYTRLSGARAGLTNRKSPLAAVDAREGAGCPVGLAFPAAPS
jgi:hypothetical protein